MSGVSSELWWSTTMSLARGAARRTLDRHAARVLAELYVQMHIVISFDVGSIDSGVDAKIMVPKPVPGKLAFNLNFHPLDSPDKAGRR